MTNKLLGKGHYGKVYLGYELPEALSPGTSQGSTFAQSMTTDRQSPVSQANQLELLACKVIDRGDKKFNAHAQQLVQNEIANLSLVRSPHVISLKKYYKTHQHFYIFTELCNGGDLNLLKKSRPNGRLSEEECQILMKKLVSGLRDLYEFDIVHRDLKLANILLHFPLE